MSEEIPYFDEELFRQEYSSRIARAQEAVGTVAPIYGDYPPIHDPNMLMDPRVLYRFVGRDAIDDALAKGYITGGTKKLPNEGFSMMGVPHFSQGVPDWNYAHRLKIEMGQNPYLMAIRPSDVDPSIGSPRIRGQGKREYRFDKGFKGKKSIIMGDELNGPPEILSLSQDPLVRKGFPWWGTKSIQDYTSLHKEPHTEVVPTVNRDAWEKYYDTKDEYSPIDAENPPHATRISLANRPFAFFDTSPVLFGKSAQEINLIESGNNKGPNGVQYIPTGKIDPEFNRSADKLLRQGSGEFKLPIKTLLLHRGDDGNLFPKEMIQEALEKYWTPRIGLENAKIKARKGFINTKALGNIAGELATPTPFEQAVSMYAKNPTAEGAKNFTKFAKANPSVIAGELLKTVGRVGAVASIAMAPSEAISRRDKLVSDFYSKPENQRLSKEEESKINAYLSVQAGLENAVNAGTMGLYDYATTPEGTEAYKKHNDSMNLYHSTGGLPLGY